MFFDILVEVFISIVIKKIQMVLFVSEINLPPDTIV